MAKQNFFSKLLHRTYKYGFTTPVETSVIERGLSENIVRLISKIKQEPEWVLDFRLRAFHYWETLELPQWAHLNIPEIDLQSISYYAAPSTVAQHQTDETLDPELVKTFQRLGISLDENKEMKVATDAIMDSVSVQTTYKDRLAKQGIIFCSLHDAIQEHPEMVRRYLGKVVSYRDNYYAALNSALFSAGTFIYIPKGVQCPVELTTYLRINTENMGQFERTLIIADEGAKGSYLEGCTAPERPNAQLHVAVGEVVVRAQAELKYSNVQNWYPGDKEGRGGVYNFVTRRGICEGEDAKLSWTQVETGAAITWQYPSCILKGDRSVGEFYTVSMTNNYQQTDAGTKMIHVGKDTHSTIVSKGISAGHSQNSYRGLVRINASADGARNYSQCDSLLIGDECGAHTFPYMDVKNPSGVAEHEATTSKISEDQIFYCNQRGISTEEALSLIVNGYANEVIQKLPMEFAVEAQRLLSISLENSVG